MSRRSLLTAILLATAASAAPYEFEAGSAWRFFPAGRTVGVVPADVDGDGRRDWITHEAGTSGFGVVLPATDDPTDLVGAATRWIEMDTPISHRLVADLDGDGWSDLIGWSQSLVIRHGIGDDELFGPPRTHQGSFLWLGPAVATDLDRDGTTDLLFSSGADLFLLRGQVVDGDWRPGDEHLMPAQQGADQLQVADLDGDGLQEIVAAKDGRASVFRFVDGPTPAVAPLVRITGDHVGLFAVADLDGDGVSDLLTTRRDHPGDDGAAADWIEDGWSAFGLTPDGAGGFAAAPLFSTTLDGDAHAILADDWDGDGAVEILVGEGGRLLAYRWSPERRGPEPVGRIRWNTGTTGGERAYGGIGVVPAGGSAPRLLTGCFWSVDAVGLLPWEPAVFPPDDGAIPVSGAPVGTFLAAPDLDGDGRRDLVSLNGDEERIVVSLAETAGDVVVSYREELTIPTSDHYDWLVDWGDVDGDGVDDLLLRDGMIRGRGADGQWWQAPNPFGTWPGVFVVDLDGDGDGDLVRDGAGGGILEQTAPGVWGELLPVATPSWSQLVDLVDVDRDGFRDLVLQGDEWTTILAGTGPGATDFNLLLEDVTGWFLQAVIEPVEVPSGSLPRRVVFDPEASSFYALEWTGLDLDLGRILRDGVEYVLGEEPAPPLRSHYGADLDGDGWGEDLAGTATGLTWIVPADAEGFGDPGPFVVGAGRPVDMDGDGDPDLVDYDLARGEIVWYRNRTPQSVPLEPRPDPVAPPRRSRLEASPNPFNATLAISWTMETPGPARLAVHDLRGRLIRVLHDGPLAAATHRFRWDGRTAAGRTAPSGLYVLRAEAGGRSVARRVVLGR